MKLTLKALASTGNYLLGAISLLVGIAVGQPSLLCVGLSLPIAAWYFTLGYRIWNDYPRVRSQLLLTQLPTLLGAALFAAYGTSILWAASGGKAQVPRLVQNAAGVSIGFVTVYALVGVLCVMYVLRPTKDVAHEPPGEQQTTA